MNIVGIIPARMGSSRFPGKPLAQINGKPMLHHVFERSCQSASLTTVTIATCDDAIAQFARSINAPVVMTGHHHERASDRTAEAMLKIESEQGRLCDIVVLIQGDEPMITPKMIDLAVAPLIQDRSVRVSNLMERIETVAEFENPNEVKVVTDRHHNALYFSREPIPSRRKGTQDVPMMKQVCVIPFQRDFLLTYTQLPPTPLEIIESVDMNRIIEHGYTVKMVYTDETTFSVDTEEDLRRVERYLGGQSS